MKRMVLLLSVGLFTAFSNAAVSVDPTDTTVTPGVWCGNFPAATNYCVTHSLPLVMVWGRSGCGHCTKLMGALGTTDGLAWAKTQDAVFCFVEGTSSWTDVAPNVGAVEFAGGVKGVSVDYLSTAPFVRFYWPAQWKSERFEGCLDADLSKADAVLLNEFVAKYVNFATAESADQGILANSVTFPMGETKNDRLEVVKANNAWLDVPVIRTNGFNVSGEVKLKYEYFFVYDPWTNLCGTTIHTVNFGLGDNLALDRYYLYFNDAYQICDKDYVRVTLLDGSENEIATRIISVLPEDVENSPKNPYWIGEKTTETLNWGEWSMDLDVVTNKVKSYNEQNPSQKSYAMMFVGGSCWCPDCAMAEKNFFSNQAFKDWAVSHRVVFGVLDIPNNPQAENAYPSQLRYESYRTSDNYVTLRGTVSADESERYQSGAGYLSRHHVPYIGSGDTAVTIAERNAFLMGHNTLNGGWNRPERENQNRTGVPVLLLLRDDGTIAARWNRFSDVGPTAYSDGYLKRFEEMLALIDDENEEGDSDKSTTQRTVADGQTISGSVSSVDQADVYEIVGAKSGDLVVFTVSGGAAELSASIIDGTTGTTLGSASGMGTVGFEASARVGSSTCYLKIAPKAVEDGAYFGYTNAASTVCAYSAQATVITGGGAVGFVAAVTNVSESCGEVLITVSRVNGSQGPASVKVRLVESVGEDVGSRIGWTDTTLEWTDREDGDKQIVLTVNPDAVANHNLVLRFALEDLTGEADDLFLGTSSMTVNIYDDDTVGASIYRDVRFENRIPVAGYQYGDTVDVSVKSGVLPPGINWTVEDGEIVLSGCATGSDGDSTAMFGIAIKRGGATVANNEVEFNGTVITYDFEGTIPSLSETHTYRQVPCVNNGRVVGLLTATIPESGTLSARYTTGGKAFGYAATEWSSFDPSSGTLTADLKRTDDPTAVMQVVLSAASGRVAFSDPLNGTSREVILPLTGLSGGASAWRGQYTVQMPQTNVVAQLRGARLTGSAFLVLRMTNETDIASGTMTYAGVLPNGRAVYGSSALNAYDDDAASMAFYHVSDAITSGFMFSGGLAIAKNAETEYRTTRSSVSSAWTPYWSVSDGVSHMSDFEVYGGYYDKDEITARFNEDYAGALNNFAFVADVSTLRTGRYGTGETFLPVLAEMTSTNMPQIAEGADNPQEVELCFSPETGIVSGNFLVPLSKQDVAVTYRGVALPGWQGCMSCSRGGDAVERPWAVGTCWFSDRDKGGSAYRNGCEIRLDRYSQQTQTAITSLASVQTPVLAAASASSVQLTSATVAAGNCQTYATSLSAANFEYTSQLVREWNENMVQAGGTKGGWTDGGNNATAVADQIGAGWFLVTMTKGKDYVVVFECDDDLEILDFKKTYTVMGTDGDGNAVQISAYPYTELKTMTSEGKIYYYVRASEWYTALDPDTVGYYFKVSGGRGTVGRSFKVSFLQMSIDDLIEYASGTIENPIQIDVTEDGTVDVSEQPDEPDQNTWGRYATAYTANLKAGETYTFAATHPRYGAYVLVPNGKYSEIPGTYSVDLDAGTLSVKVTEDYQIVLIVVPDDTHYDGNVAGATLSWQLGEIEPAVPAQPVWTRTYTGILKDVDGRISADFEIIAQGMDDGTTNLSASVGIDAGRYSYVDSGNSEEMNCATAIGSKTFTSILGVTLIDETTARIDGLVYLDRCGAAAFDFSGILGEQEPSDSFEDHDATTETAAEMGITADAFKNEEAGSISLQKLCTWGADHGVSISSINADMAFTADGDPVGQLAEAYLLDCEPTDAAIKAAAEEFVIESIDPATGRVVIRGGAADGEDYGNGHVEVRTSATLGGSYDVSDKDASTVLFFKAYLVK